MKTLFGALALAMTMQVAALAQSTPMPSASGAAMQTGGAVTLVPVGKKGPAGSAVLLQQGGNLQVTLHLPSGYQSTKAAIYSGTCKSNGTASMTGGQSYPLTVGTGSSNSAEMTTLQNLTIESLTASPHVIVVMGTPALCGDISNLLPPQKP